MNSKFIKALMKLKGNLPYGRNAFIIGIGVILLMASLAAMNSLNVAAASGGEIRATGTESTVIVSPDIAQRTQGDLDIRSRYAVSTYTGSLVGTAVSVQNIARDDVVEKKAFQTNTASFWGTFNGKSGSFAYIIHIVTDRSACPCPPGLIPFEYRLVVVEGTGTGGFEGICGGGTGTRPSGIGPSSYDFTFRFGKDCKANN
ncbi:MAG: DUF3224 domain-containing protein [Thaumarchaeota archaeon]|nr:DUF3224 domain-containing protein [Nitrososphaerota archaeon]